MKKGAVRIGAIAEIEIEIDVAKDLHVVEAGHESDDVQIGIGTETEREIGTETLEEEEKTVVTVIETVTVSVTVEEKVRMNLRNHARIQKISTVRR